MAKRDHKSGQKRDWAAEFQKNATPEIRALFADHILEVALVNGPDTAELKLLRMAPYIIVGCLNARDVPLTNHSLAKALDNFADPVIVAANLEQDMLGADFDLQYGGGEEVADLPADDPETTAQDNAMFERLRARFEKTAAIGQQVEDAMLPTLRQELKLDAQASAYDTYQELSRTVTRGFAQLFEAALPGSTTDRNHDIWKTEMVSSVVGAYRTQLQTVVLQQAQQLGMVRAAGAAKPADPNPMH